MQKRITPQLTHHARRRAREMGVEEAAVYLTATEPRVTYPSRQEPGCEFRVRDELAVVINERQTAIITVLWAERTARSEGPKGEHR